MKDFKKGLSFGMGIVNAGQRAVSEEPELVVVSTPGSFRMTAQVSKALGIAHGEYVMFINNCANIDNAIINKVPELLLSVKNKVWILNLPKLLWLFMLNLIFGLWLKVLLN